jgi:hypothetical protein
MKMCQWYFEKLSWWCLIYDHASINNARTRCKVSLSVVFILLSYSFYMMCTVVNRLCFYAESFLPFFLFPPFLTLNNEEDITLNFSHVRRYEFRCHAQWHSELWCSISCSYIVSRKVESITCENLNGKNMSIGSSTKLLFVKDEGWRTGSVSCVIPTGCLGIRLKRFLIEFHYNQAGVDEGTLVKQQHGIVMCCTAIFLHLNHHWHPADI